MGEAKCRGTFEERKKAAICRDREILEKRRVFLQSIENAKSPEERKKEILRERETRTLMCHMMAITAPYMDMWEIANLHSSRGSRHFYSTKVR